MGIQEILNLFHSGKATAKSHMKNLIEMAAVDGNFDQIEFDLLKTFLISAGHILSREEMVRAVLSREFSPYDRSIDTHVSNLRKKLGPRPDGSERIKGVRGIGYIYVLES